jgi:hypothetical protein
LLPTTTFPIKISIKPPDYARFGRWRRRRPRGPRDEPARRVQDAAPVPGAVARENGRGAAVGGGIGGFAIRNMVFFSWVLLENVFFLVEMELYWPR